METRGLHLEMSDGETLTLTQLKTAAQVREAGQHDLVLLSVKAHQISDLAADLPALFGPETMVVTLQNGIPWWYFQRHGGELEGTRIQALDPFGMIQTHIDPERILGCVAYPAAAMPEPGLIRHIEGNRFPVGELDGRESERVLVVADMLAAAGFKSRVIPDIRAEIWLKAWGTMSINPISALTHATMEEICRFPETRKLVVTMMQEAQDVAEKLGITFRHTIQKRVAGAESVGPHKTSMLQDVEVGRDLELDALMAAVIELGTITGTATPALEAVHAVVKLLEDTYLRAGGRVGLIASGSSSPG